MADEEHLKILRRGLKAWNAWRNDHKDIVPDLREADLKGVDFVERDVENNRALEGIDLTGAKLERANLRRAHLKFAKLQGANLQAARLYGTILQAADLTGTNFKGARLELSNLSSAELRGANLEGANLRWANLERAKLSGACFRDAVAVLANLDEALMDDADLEGATLGKTILTNLDLSATKGLSSCRHAGPSTVDHRTVVMSKNVPPVFWRGCGLPDPLIDNMPFLADAAVQFYSCFISYSSKDQEFAERLYVDLQDKGVRCWFAPHDLEIGAFIEEDIDAQIRMRDKVILILSEASVESGWVTHEVKTALDEEQKSKRRVLFPLRLDDAVMDTTEQWAHSLRRKRNIGNFTQWKDHDAYMDTFDRVLRDLKATR